MGWLARRRCRRDGHTLLVTSHADYYCNYNRYECTRCGWTDTWLYPEVKVASQRLAEADS